MTNTIGDFGLPLRPKNNLRAISVDNPEVFYWAIRPSETLDTKN
jgi:hypothetical protein